MTKQKPRARAVLFQAEDPHGLCYPPDVHRELAELVDLPRGGSAMAADILKLTDWLSEIRMVVGTWGMPLINRELLDRMPRLEAVFYAGGAVGHDVLSAEVWRRGIRVSTTMELNSQCTAQMALAQILFALKFGWHHQMNARVHRRWRRLDDIPGTHGSRVGIVSVGSVGRRLVSMLRPFGVEILAYDIHASPQLAAKHGVRFVGLDELFSSCHVVSIHTPLLPETRGMIGMDLIRSMRPNGVLINTSRGAIVDQPALEAVLKDRPDLIALLDVLDPEPPAADSALWEMPNVFLTPHIAGAFGHERRRLGQFEVDEVRRYLQGKPLRSEVLNPLRSAAKPHPSGTVAQVQARVTHSP